MKRRLVLAGTITAATLATLVVPVAHYVVWNVTASVPTGLYVIRGKASLQVGERVAVDPPPELARLLAERGYLPTGVPLLKRVAAMSGQHVCRHGRRITIDGHIAGEARPADRFGRPLPAWSGCRTLRRGELFLMSPNASTSFDGRYIGALPMSAVIGRATPVWTDETGTGARVWFADPRAERSPHPTNLTDPNTTNEGDLS